MKDAAAGVRHFSEARHKFASRRSWRAKHLRLSSGGNTTRLSQPDTGCLVFSVQRGALAFMSSEARRMYSRTTKHLKYNYQTIQALSTRTTISKLVLVRIKMSLPLYGQQNVISPKCVLEKSNTPHSVSSRGCNINLTNNFVSIIHDDTAK